MSKEVDNEFEEIRLVFLEECVENTDLLEKGLLALDAGQRRPGLFDDIFRAAHSIKGGGATMGFTEVAGYMHHMETLMDEMRQGKREPEPSLLTELLDCVDYLRQMLQQTRDNESIDSEVLQAKQARLEKLAGVHTGAALKMPKATAVSTDPGNYWRIRFEPPSEILLHGNEPLRIFRELESLGNLTIYADSSALPSLAQLDPELCYLKFDIELESTKSKQEIEAAFEWVAMDSVVEFFAVPEAVVPIGESSVSQMEIAHLAKLQASGLVECAQAVQSAASMTSVTQTPNPTDSKSAAVAKPQPAASQSSEANSIRVSTDKIDDLINLVGELVITQSMLTRLSVSKEGFNFEEFQDGLSALVANTRELQDSVMKVRMLPVSFSFNRFPRMVRDITQRLGKQVRLEIDGEATELDKTVLERISDPLVHLVRNSLDHGIEKPEDRIAAGKPAEGTIFLSARHEGGNVVLEVSDDGRGLPKEKLLAKARQNNIIGPNDQLNEEQIHELIFHPGLSTAQSVNDLSGRGVGMDVVRNNIRELGGRMEVWSKEGFGSRFTIRLPLTLAILDGQLVRMGDQTFVISLISIVESVSLRDTPLMQVPNHPEVFRSRDRYLPILYPKDVLGVECDMSGSPQIVVIESGRSRVGLVVNELLSQQQVVIKSLETNYGEVSGCAGATILGDGAIALILDVPHLVAMFGEQGQSLVLVAA